MTDTAPRSTASSTSTPSRTTPSGTTPSRTMSTARSSNDNHSLTVDLADGPERSWTEGTVSANGLTIAYRTQGSGEPLLAVMGLGGQLTDWPQGFLDILARSFTVITFDNRDIGLSTELSGPTIGTKDHLRLLLTRRKPDAAYLLRDMADDAAGLLDALSIGSAHVMGMSMGGMISQALAIHHPSRVRSLTSVMSHTGDGRNGTTDPRILPKLAKLQDPAPERALANTVSSFRLFAGSSWDEAEHRERARASIARSFRPEGTGRQLAAIMASPDRTEALGRVDVPTLVIHGLEDTLVRPSGGTATAAAVPGARLLMFPDMGHDLPNTRWDEMADAIVRNAARAQPVASGQS